MKVIGKILCIGIVVMLVTVTVSFATAASETSLGGPRVYHGPKEVYDVKAEKGKPPSPPGQGKPPTGPQPDPSVNKWAVVIGISKYKGGGNLLYPDDDGRDMYNYLLAKGYPAGNIKLLLDRDATAKNIMAAIDWLNSWENGSSEVVFFYSGHGSTYDGYNDGDSEYTDEAIVSTDPYLILDGQLREKFSTFSSSKISFIFDSCFSGGMDDLVGAWTGTTITGRVVVAACGENQYSYDGTAAQQNGVFTYYYMNGLNTYNTIEGAFTYAAPLAHDFVLQQYSAQMDPQMYDMYTGDWTF